MLAAPRYLFGEEAGCHKGRDAINHSEADDGLGQEAGNNFRGTCRESGRRFVRASSYISCGQASACFYLEMPPHSVGESQRKGLRYQGNKKRALKPKE